MRECNAPIMEFFKAASEQDLAKTFFASLHILAPLHKHSNCKPVDLVRLVRPWRPSRRSQPFLLAANA
jgi:hypothetical protein